MAYRQQTNDLLYGKERLRIPLRAVRQLLWYYSNWRRASSSVRNNGSELSQIADALTKAIREQYTAPEPHSISNSATS